MHLTKPWLTFSILLVIYLQVSLISSHQNVSLQTFNKPGFQGQSEPVTYYESDCLNLKSEIKSVKSSSCVMLYTDENCEGYSRKIVNNEEVSNLGSDKYFGHFFYQIKSVHACNETLGGNLSFVDIYEGEYPEGKLLAKFENVNECTQMVNVTPGVEVSMDNHGNCVKIYSENNCTGPLEKIPAGYHPLYHPLRVIITDNKTKQIWKTPIIRSFKPCKIYAEDTTEQDKKAKKLIWILSSTGVTLLLAIFIIFVCLIWKIRRQNAKIKQLTPEDALLLLNGNPEHLKTKSSEEYVNNFAKALSYDEKYEIPEKQLERYEDRLLGSGNFGVVCKGTLVRPGLDKTEVAVKTLKNHSNDNMLLESFVSELKMMIYIGAHPHIVNLLGAQTKKIRNREVYIAMEFCGLGSLQKYLQENRANFSNDSDIESERGLNSEALVKWAYQVANGMEFLSKRHVIHGDLAARNVLLTEDLTAKISDFGLSRKIMNFDAVYVKLNKEKNTPLPWKWLPVECLREDEKPFSVKSDVWAYGILLFEIFSLGKTPYPGTSFGDEFIQGIIDGNRPNRPEHATEKIYSIMTSCWLHNPEERPDFSLLCGQLKEILNCMGPYSFLVEAEESKETFVLDSTPQVKRRVNAVTIA